MPSFGRFEEHIEFIVERVIENIQTDTPSPGRVENKTIQVVEQYDWIREGEKENHLDFIGMVEDRHPYVDVESSDNDMPGTYVNRTTRVALREVSKRRALKEMRRRLYNTNDDNTEDGSSENNEESFEDFSES